MFQQVGRGRALKLALAAMAALAVVLTMGRAEGAYPGANGKIAFETTRDGNLEIYSMNPDGSQLTNLTEDPAEDTDPVWSPDGTQIAFVKASEGHRNIYVMNADGSEQTNLTPGAETTGQANGGVQPTWSPDGSQIAYNHSGEIWVMNADGSGKHKLTDGTEPSWGVNNRIAFVRDGDIWVMDADGSNQEQLTTHDVPSQSKRSPDWSPDGSQIVYTSGPGSSIWVMDADGGRQHMVANNGILPAWSPDGESIVFSSSSQQYGAPNGNDLFVVDADGGVPVRLPGAAVPATDSDPNWQPADQPSPSSTTSTTTSPSSTTTTSSTIPATTTTSTTVPATTTTSSTVPATTTTVAGPTTTTTTRPTTRPGACDDGRDNDGDGLVDFTLDAGQRIHPFVDVVLTGDPGCSSPQDTDERNPTVECDDGVDNDGDGQRDTIYRFTRTGGDDGCSAPADTSERFECDDGIDNDGDGVVDSADRGCVGVRDDSEVGDLPRGGTVLGIACDDGVDNDNDGRVDYRVDGSGDPGCTSATDRDERQESRTMPCDDGRDNDGDGLADFTVDGGEWFPAGLNPRPVLADPGCSSITDTDERDPDVACDDGIDNDGDGEIDTEYGLDQLRRVNQRIGGDPGCSSPTDVSEDFDCDDGLDNDGDGEVDADDPSCESAQDPTEMGDAGPTGRGELAPACDDGVDNDNDGRVDYRVDGSGDPGCTGPADRDEKSQSRDLPCDDGRDNDGDGMADFTVNGEPWFSAGLRIQQGVAADPGCAGPADTSEENPDVECDDGVDNDGDGATDTVFRFVRIGGDEGCASPTDDSERFDCDDGVDNDGDGRVDTADPGCTGVSDPSELAERGAQRLLSQCDDGVDNDNDGLVDFRPGGTGDPGCEDPRDPDERVGGGGPGGGPGPNLMQRLQPSLVTLPALASFLGR